MATDDDIVKQLDEINRQLRRKDDFSALLKDEDLENLQDYFKSFNDQIRNFGRQINEISNDLEDITKKLVAVFETNKADMETYHKEFLNIQKEEDLDEQIKKYDSLIEKMKKMGTEAGKAAGEFAKEIKKKRESQKEIRLESNKVEDEKTRREKMAATIMRSHRGVQDTVFNKLGIQAMYSKADMHPLYALLDEIRNKRMDPEFFKRLFINIPGALIKNRLDWLNLFVNTLSNIRTQTIKYLMDLDEVSTSLGKTIGDTERYREVLNDSYRDLRFYNISLEDVSNSIQALAENIRGFSAAREEDQRHLVDYVAVLGRLGVGYDVAAKALSFYTDTLGRTKEESIGSISRILGLSETTGESFKKILSDFNSVTAEIAKYGNQATNVFVQMFATAKALKIETSQLLDVARQFDTFDSAATSVGRLNAILGGPFLNTIQLMNQNEGERIQTLNAAFKATGRNWQQLGKYEKQALAAAAGITDMNLAERLFNGSLEDSARYMRDVSIRQDELNERNKRAATLQEQFASIMSSLSVALKPVLDVLKGFLGIIADVMNALGDANILAIPLLLMGSSLLMRLGKAFISAFTSGKIFGGILKGLQWGLDKFTKASKTAADAASNAAPALDKAVKPAKALNETLNGTKTIGSGFGASANAIAGGILKIGFAIVAVAGAGFALYKLIDGLSNALFDTKEENIIEALADLEGGKGALNAFESLWKTMSTMPLANVTEGAENAIVAILDALDGASFGLSADVSNGFLNSISRFMETASSITPTKLENIKQVTSNIIEMSNKIKDSKSGAETLNKIENIISSMNSANKDKNGNITIVVKVGDETLVKKTLSEIDKRGDVYSFGVGN